MYKASLSSFVFSCAASIKAQGQEVKPRYPCKVKNINQGQEAPWKFGVLLCPNGASPAGSGGRPIAGVRHCPQSLSTLQSFSFSRCRQPRKKENNFQCFLLVHIEIYMLQKPQTYQNNLHSKARGMGLIPT